MGQLLLRFKYSKPKGEFKGQMIREIFYWWLLWKSDAPRWIFIAVICYLVFAIILSVAKNW